MANKGREWQNDKDNKQRPPPHVLKARGLLQAAKALPTVSDDIKTQCDRLLRLSDAQLAQTVFVCKTTKAWDRAKLRVVLEVEFSERIVFNQILQALLPPGTRQIVGVAPRNNLEREIADALVELGIFSAPNEASEK